MLKSVVFDDEITIYWDLNPLYKIGYKYRINFCGKQYYTDKTHYKFDFLQSQSLYDIEVELLDYSGNIIDLIGILNIKTKKRKHKLDVSLPPYNAVGDGKTLNTTSLQKALDDCTAEDYVFIPKGEFLTGSLRVHSDSEIYIDKDGIIKGTTNIEDYLPKIKSRFEGIEQMCYSSLINIGNLDRDLITCENVTIRGEGKIIGGGRELSDNIIEKEKIELKKSDISLIDIIDECEHYDTIPGRARGRLINVSSANNIIFSGIKFFDGPAWNLHFIYSENIITQHCQISSYRVHNGDGWNPDSSHDCTIFDCDFSTSDDCIAIKSGKNPEGNIINKPSYNINIFDIRIKCGYGVSIGSEMSGGVYDVKIWDIYSDFVGITIKAAEKRGGYIKNISAFNSRIGSLVLTATVGYNNDGKCADSYSDLRDFYFENIFIVGKGLRIFKDKNNKIDVYDKSPIFINGLGKQDTYIKNVTIKDCKIVKSSKTKIDCNNSQQINIINLIDVEESDLNENN